MEKVKRIKIKWYKRFGVWLFMKKHKIPVTDEIHNLKCDELINQVRKENSLYDKE